MQVHHNNCYKPIAIFHNTCHNILNPYSYYTIYPEALLFCCFYLFTPLYSVKYGTFLFLSKYNPSTVDYIEKQ